MEWIFDDQIVSALFGFVKYAHICNLGHTEVTIVAPQRFRDFKKFAAIATIGASAGLSGADWSIALSAPVLAGALSLPTSVAGLPEVERHGRRAKDVGQA